ncbi:MAG TPA: hypothetical protein VGI20_13710 [Rhizomicrobium sp.]
MLEAALFESTETVAHTPCSSIWAAWAKGIALDGVRGMAAAIRLGFSFLDILDGVEKPPRRGPGIDRAPRDMAGVSGSEPGAASLEQGIIEKKPLRMWCEYVVRQAHHEGKEEALTLSLSKGEPDSAAESRSGHPAQGHEQAVKSEKAESERHLLTVAAMKPDKDELRRIAWEKGQERNRRLDASIRAKLEKAMSRTTPYTEEELKKFEEARANEGPAKRALRARFERLIEANRLEAERKAALAVVPQAHPVRQAHHEGKEEALTLSSSKGEPNPEPLPDFSIWMRGQPAQMP